mmetsp:Transcript_12986/g.29571  ORF Transcript_12986/g.29571 Transcript_12986/m.29571 type:complete len:642 (-) Transcript_12986:67-1992(-)
MTMMRWWWCCCRCSSSSFVSLLLLLVLLHDPSSSSSSSRRGVITTAQATFSIVAVDLQTSITGCAATSCIGSRSIDVVCGGTPPSVVAAQALLGEYTVFPCYVSVGLPQEVCNGGPSSRNPQVFSIDTSSAATCRVSCCSLQFLKLPPGERRRQIEQEFSEMFASHDVYFRWASKAWKECNDSAEGAPPSRGIFHTPSFASSASDWPLRDALAEALERGDTPEEAVTAIIAPGRDWLWGGAESRQYTACDKTGCSSFQGRSCWANPRCDRCEVDDDDVEQQQQHLQFNVASRADMRDPLQLHLAGYTLLGEENQTMMVETATNTAATDNIPPYSRVPIADANGVRRCWPFVFAGAMHGAAISANDTAVTTNNTNKSSSFTTATTQHDALPLKTIRRMATTGGVGTTQWIWQQSDDDEQPPSPGLHNTRTTSSATTIIVHLDKKPRYLFSVQGNTLTSKNILERAADAFGSYSPPPLIASSPSNATINPTCEMALRLLAALRAGAGKDTTTSATQSFVEGDVRCVTKRGVAGNSASLRVMPGAVAGKEDIEEEEPVRFDAAFPPHAARADALASLSRAVQGWADATCTGKTTTNDGLRSSASIDQTASPFFFTQIGQTISSIWQSTSTAFAQFVAAGRTADP